MDVFLERKPLTVADIQRVRQRVDWAVWFADIPRVRQCVDFAVSVLGGWKIGKASEIVLGLAGVDSYIEIVLVGWLVVVVVVVVVLLGL